MSVPGTWGREGTGKWHSMMIFMDEVGLQLSLEVRGRETKDGLFSSSLLTITSLQGHFGTKKS